MPANQHVFAEGIDQAALNAAWMMAVWLLIHGGDPPEHSEDVPLDLALTGLAFATELSKFMPGGKPLTLGDVKERVSVFARSAQSGSNRPRVLPPVGGFHQGILGVLTPPRQAPVTGNPPDDA